MYQTIKLFAESVYYLIYLTLDIWINEVFVLTVIMASVVGITLANQGKKIQGDWKLLLTCFIAILYAGIILLVYCSGTIPQGIPYSILRCIYYVGTCAFSLYISNIIWDKLTRQKRITKETCDKQFYIRWKRGIVALFIGGILPFVFLSPYIYAKADDYSFGYHAHIAWEQTGSIVEVIKAAFVMIKEAYVGWQGTYTSIFMMAIQPAVFHERLYGVVPFFLIGSLTVASYFFLKTIFIDWLKSDRIVSQMCIWMYILFVIQCIPIKQSAFIWYNGAVHYIISHCMVLVMFAFIIRLYIGKRIWSNWLGAALAAFYVGGGNYVTCVGTLLLCITILFFILITKKWKNYRGIASICIIYFGALAINVAAPGNYSRMARAEGYNIVTAFILAFAKSIEYMLGRWMNWTVFVFILLCLPLVWRMVQKVDNSFKYPLLIIGYSWCYMASLFFAPLYTISVVDTGRFQNIMYLQWILLLMFDIAYFMGWMQRKYKIPNEVGWVENERKYMYRILLFSIGAFCLCAKAEPQNYTSVHAIKTLLEEDLQNYQKEYWEMVEILNSNESKVKIKNFSHVPEFLNPSESEEWYSGLRLFYGKDEIVMK